MTEKVVRQHRALHNNLVRTITHLCKEGYNDQSVPETVSLPEKIILGEETLMTIFVDTLKLKIDKKEIQEMMKSISPNIANVRLSDLVRVLTCVEAPGIPVLLQLSPGRDARPVTAYGNKGQPGSTQRRQGLGFGRKELLSSESPEKGFSPVLDGLDPELDSYRQRIFSKLLNNLQDSFEKMDSEGSGLVGVYQVAKTFDSLGLHIEGDFVTKFMSDLGVDGGDKIIIEQVLENLLNEDKRYTIALANSMRTRNSDDFSVVPQLSAPPLTKYGVSEKAEKKSQNEEKKKRQNEEKSNKANVSCRRELKPATVVVDMDLGMLRVDNTAKSMGGKFGYSSDENPEEFSDLPDDHVDAGDQSSEYYDDHGDEQWDNGVSSIDVVEDNESDECNSPEESNVNDSERAMKLHAIKSSLNSRMIWLAKQCNALEQAHRKLQRQLRSEKNKTRKWKHEFEDAKQLATEFSQKCRDIENINEEKLKRIDELRRRLGQKDRRISGFKTQLKTWNTKMSSMQTRCDHLEREANRWQDRHEKLDVRYRLDKKNMMRENAILKGQVEKNGEELIHQVKLIKGRVNLADAKADAACGKLGHWQHQAEKLKRKLEEANVKHQEAQQLAEKEIEKHANHRLEESTKCEETLQILTKRLKEAEESLTKKNSELEEKNEKLAHAVERKERQLVDAGGLLDAWRFEKDDLQRLLREYEARNAQQSEELSSIQCEVMKQMRLRQAAQREKCLHHVEVQDMKRRMQKMSHAFQQHINRAKQSSGNSDEVSAECQLYSEAAHKALEVKRMEDSQAAAMRIACKGKDKNKSPTLTDQKKHTRN